MLENLEHFRIGQCSWCGGGLIGSLSGPHFLHRFGASGSPVLRWLRKGGFQCWYLRNVQVTAWSVASRHGLLSIHTPPACETLSSQADIEENWRQLYRV